MRNGLATGYRYIVDGNTLRVREKFSPRKSMSSYPGRNINKDKRRNNPAAKPLRRPYAKGQKANGFAADYIYNSNVPSRVAYNSKKENRPMTSTIKSPGYVMTSKSPHDVSKRQRFLSSDARRNLSRLEGTLTLPLTVLLMGMVALVLYFGFDYLRLSASLDEHMDKIQTLESSLEALKNENDALEEDIDTSINLNEIYDEAVNRLGMVRADGDSVITYDKKESEYVIQYDDIPQTP